MSAPALGRNDEMGNDLKITGTAWQNSVVSGESIVLNMPRNRVEVTKDSDASATVRAIVGHPRAIMEKVDVWDDYMRGPRGMRRMTITVSVPLDAIVDGDKLPTGDVQTIANMARALTGEGDADAVARKLAAHYVTNEYDVASAFELAEGVMMPRELRRKIADAFGFTEAPTEPWVQVGAWAFCQNDGPRGRPYEVIEVDGHDVFLDDAHSSGDAEGERVRRVPRGIFGRVCQRFDMTNPPRDPIDEDVSRGFAAFDREQQKLTWGRPRAATPTIHARRPRVIKDRHGHILASYNFEDPYSAEVAERAINEATRLKDVDAAWTTEEDGTRVFVGDVGQARPCPAWVKPGAWVFAACIYLTDHVFGAPVTIESVSADGVKLKDPLPTFGPCAIPLSYFGDGFIQYDPMKMRPPVESDVRRGYAGIDPKTGKLSWLDGPPSLPSRTFGETMMVKAGRHVERGQLGPVTSVNTSEDYAYSNRGPERMSLDDVRNAAAAIRGSEQMTMDDVRRATVAEAKRLVMDKLTMARLSGIPGPKVQEYRVGDMTVCKTEFLREHTLADFSTSQHAKSAVPETARAIADMILKDPALVWGETIKSMSDEKLLLTVQSAKTAEEARRHLQWSDFYVHRAALTKALTGMFEPSEPGSLWRQPTEEEVVHAFFGAMTYENNRSSDPSAAHERAMVACNYVVSKAAVATYIKLRNERS